MALSELDRNLIERCLARKPKSWEDFVDRFMGLVVHVINHTAQARSLRLTPEDREELVADVLLALIKDDFAVLRHFRGQSSLATYLCVVSRRVVVRKLLQRQVTVPLGDAAMQHAAASNGGGPNPQQQLGDRDEIERLLEELDVAEARVVRMYHLEGKSYHEISTAVGMPENSIGPTLSRAREKMRRAGAERTA